MDFLGDYILVSQQEWPKVPSLHSFDHSPRVLQLVSWKTGDVTCVSDVIAFLSSYPHRTDETPKLRESIDLESGTGHKPSVIDPDDSLIALVDGPKNRLEICKLVLQSHRPYLQTLCYLELPQLKPNIH